MLRDVPFNLVTGFLGAGKTTLLRHLLATRPAGARWAVLVNEFGETGIDGALLAEPGVFVKEVPGGCLCCANGVPFRIALNLLLAKAKPERLLIEPTGLGHPLQLLSQLSSAEYRDVLSPRATLCVIDPLAAQEPRVAGHEVFRQQLAAADAFVLNHADRAAESDFAAIGAMLATAGLAAVPRVRVARGAIDSSLLEVPVRAKTWFLLPPPAESGMQHAGATWPADVVFPHDDTLSLLLALPVARMRPGEQSEYSAGGAMLAVKASVPVVLNSGDCWPRGTLLKKPGVIRVQFGAPIGTAETSAKLLNEQVRSWIEPTVAKISLQSGESPAA